MGVASPQPTSISNGREQLKSLQSMADVATAAVYEVHQPPSWPLFDSHAAAELDELWAALSSKMHQGAEINVVQADHRTSKKIEPSQGEASTLDVHKSRLKPKSEASSPPRMRASTHTVTLLHDFDQHHEIFFAASEPVASMASSAVSKRPALARDALLELSRRSVRRGNGLHLARSLGSSSQSSHSSGEGAARPQPERQSRSVAMRISSYSQSETSRSDERHSQQVMFRLCISRQLSLHPRTQQRLAPTSLRLTSCSPPGAPSHIDSIPSSPNLLVHTSLLHMQ